MKGVAVAGAENRLDYFWLDDSFAMSSVYTAHTTQHHGGVFTSVPAAVASMVRQPLGGVLDAVDTGVPLSNETIDVAGGSDVEARAGTTRGRGRLGDTGAEPVVRRVDVFGLGVDYAMFTKSFFGDYGDTPDPWYRLGGIFTSAPAAIARGERVDVFGLGVDHAMFTKTREGDRWTSDWQRLGGAFTSAASVVSGEAGRLDLFARGSDFTLRHNQLEGTNWFGWQNLGGSLASPPAAVSWGPDRLDVFAVFNDGQLHHRWWDGQLWNDWESLGGSYTGEPAVASWAPGRIDVFVTGIDHAVHHYWFSGDTWSLPESMGGNMTSSPTVISLAPDRLDVFAPGVDRGIHRRTWDGQAWTVGDFGSAITPDRSPIKLPTRYRLSVDLVHAETARSLNNDTDAASASVAIGNWAVDTKTQWLGKLGWSAPEEGQTNLLDFEPVTIELAEPASFNYIVVNNGHASQDDVLEALKKGSDSLSLASVASATEEIEKGLVNLVSVKLAEALTVPVFGSIVEPAEEWLLGKLTDAAFADCDGLVATELIALTGRALHIKTENGRKAFSVTTRHNGTDSPALCGNNSKYDVTWSIKPV